MAIARTSAAAKRGAAKGTSRHAPSGAGATASKAKRATNGAHSEPFMPAVPSPAMPVPKTADVAAAKLKQKLVRDSFTIPKQEYAVLAALKQRAIRLQRPVKKSELLRAGIAALQAMPDTELLSALQAVPSLKTGRPKHSAKP